MTPASVVNVTHGSPCTAPWTRLGLAPLAAGAAALLACFAGFPCFAGFGLEGRATPGGAAHADHPRRVPGRIPR